MASSKIKSLEAKALQATTTTSANADTKTTAATSTATSTATTTTASTIKPRLSINSHTTSSSSNSSLTSQKHQKSSLKIKSPPTTTATTTSIIKHNQLQQQQQYHHHNSYQNITNTAVASASVPKTLNPSAAATQKFKSKQLLKATTKVKKKTKQLTFDNTPLCLLQPHTTTPPPLSTTAYPKNAFNLRKYSLPTNLTQTLQQQNSPSATNIKTPSSHTTVPPKSDYVLSQTSKVKKSKTTKRFTRFLRAAASSSNSPHSKGRRKSSAASIVETALAAAGVTVNLTNASASSASATELLAQDLYTKTPTPASNCDLSATLNCGESATGETGPTTAGAEGEESGRGGEESSWCGGGVNFLVYMVCSFCCCCYNFRNSPTR